MAGVESIRERIMKEAGRRAEEQLKRARAEADKLLENARKEAETVKRSIASKAESDSIELTRRLISSAELEGRKTVLKAKHELIDSVYRSVAERLASLPRDRYVQILADMIVHGVHDVHNEMGEVLLSPEDSASIGGDIAEEVNKRLEKSGRKARVRVSGQTGHFTGGFVLRIGNVEINNTFDAILRTQRDVLEAEIVRVLFG